MPATAATEIERKYDVLGDVTLPGLTDVRGVARVVSREHHLEATYLETPSRALTRHHITLRRRRGGDDAGWHLKLPGAGDARTEMSHPLGADDEPVPSELAALVRAVVRREPLVPTVRLSTTRLEVDLVSDDGTVLAKVADDLVTAERLDRAAPLRNWREWEVELVEGDPALIGDVAVLLLAAGATEADHPSKFVRALGEDVPADDWPTPQTLPKKPTAGAAMQAHLGQHVRALVDQDRRVRLDLEDSVHKMRVAARRLRSALKTYEPLLQPEGIEELEEDLRWIGQVLGVARDAEVLRDHLADLLDQLPTDAVRGPVRARIAERLQSTYESGRLDAVVQLDGDRYLTMLDRLDDLVLRPQTTDLAASKARKALPRLLAADLRKVTRAHRAATSTSDPVEHDLALHEVRKKSKRLRYAAESAVPVLGDRARDLAERAEAIQEALGEHQDSVVARQRLLELADVAHEAGEDTFTYGRLHAAEEQRGAHVEEEFRQTWKRLPHRRIRSWLDKG